MDWTRRSAAGLFLVAALALAAWTAPRGGLPSPGAFSLFRGADGRILWTRDVSLPDGSILDGAGTAVGRLGGAAGLLTGARLDPATATFEDWLVLPGVGEKTAREILSTRARLGGFASSGELIEVKGIGPKKLAALSPWLAGEGR